MEKKKRLQKVTVYVLAVLIVCTGLARQFQAMQLPQVMTAKCEPGTVSHKDIYPAIAQGFIVSWTVDQEGYQYYGENTKAALTWMDPDGMSKTEICKIKKKKQNDDGTWTFTLNAKKMAKEAGGGLFGTLSVTMENEIAYPYTLPLSALSMDADGYVVFVVQTRQGMFSDEQFAARMSQRVLDRDDFIAAVSHEWTEQVITYTSRPLADQMRVIIAE